MMVHINDRSVQIERYEVKTDADFDPQCDVCITYLGYYKENLEKLERFRFGTLDPVIPRDQAGRLFIKIANDDLESVLEWYNSQAGEIGKYGHVESVTAITTDGVRHTVLTDYNKEELSDDANT